MSLLETRLQTLRARYPSNFDNVELRTARFPILQMAKNQTAAPESLITGELRSLIAASYGNSVEVPVARKPDTTLISARTCTIPVTASSSERVMLTFVTLGFNVAIFPGMNAQNQISEKQDFELQVTAGAEKMAANMELAVIAALDMYRNSYWSNVTGTGLPFAQSGNALQVPLARQSEFYATLPALMRQANFYGAIDVASSNMHEVVINKIASQGQGNATNTAFSLNGYRNWAFSPAMPNGSGVGSTAYYLNPGSVGIANRNDWESRTNQTLGNGAYFTITDLPILGLPVSVYSYENCTDASAIAAVQAAFGAGTATRTIGKFYQFTTDYTIVTPFIPTGAGVNRYAPIFKAEFLTT